MSISLLRCGLALAAAAPLVLSACTPYQRRDVDVAAHAELFRQRTAASVAIAADPNAPFDLADGCSLREAEAIALVLNPGLRVGRAKLGVAEATAAESGRWSDPVLAADVTRVLESVAEPWKLAVSVGITLPLSGRLDAERRHDDAARDAELLRVHAAEWSTRIAVRRAWVERITAERRRAEIADAIGRVDGVARIAARLEELGEIGRIEARLFRIDIAVRRERLIGAEAALADADLTLRALLGLPAAAGIDFVGDLPEANVGDDSHVRERLVTGSTEIAIARADYEVAERTLALEVRKQYPDLTIGPGYGREDGNNQFLLGLSLPLPILNANRQAIATANAGRDLASTALTSLIEEQILHLERAIVRHNAALRRLQLFGDEVMPLAHSQFEDAKRVADLGEVDTLVLLESLTRRSDAQLALLDAQRDAALAALDIDLLVGPTHDR
jgi:cobalt-zinc-cadmium efflux system outer membrane protein